MSRGSKRRQKSWFWVERDKSHEEGQWYPIPCSIWKTTLFRMIPPPAKVVYTEFRNRCYTSRENIPFTYSDASELGLSHKVFNRALEILENNGFIKCVAKGGLLNNPSLYNLETDWFDNERKLKENREKYLSEHFPNKIKHREIMNQAREKKNKQYQKNQTDLNTLPVILDNNMLCIVPFLIYSDIFSGITNNLFTNFFSSIYKQLYTIITLLLMASIVFVVIKISLKKIWIIKKGMILFKLNSEVGNYNYFEQCNNNIIKQCNNNIVELWGGDLKWRKIKIIILNHI